MFFKKKQNKQTKRVYLDWAAATPMLSDVHVAMEPWLMTEYGNPSSIHQEGLSARRAIDESRASIGRVLEIKPEQITFTSGGTEANNLAIFGVINHRLQSGFQYEDMEVITTKLEHPSVGKAVEELASRGVTMQYVAVDETGRIDLEDLEEKLSDKTVLVSCAHANSEIGTIQPLHAIKKILTAAEATHANKILWHLDAAQTPLWLSCQFNALGADLVTLDAGKFQGPKGIGILLQSRRSEITSVWFGGGQERGFRPGTENVAGIVGCAVALKTAQVRCDGVAENVQMVRDQAFEYMREQIPDAIINGAKEDKRLPNNINISIPGIDTEYAAVVLDSKGFAVSTKSACSGAGGGESAVVKTISDDTARAASTLRFSLGPNTTFENIKSAIDTLAKHIVMMRELG